MDRLEYIISEVDKLKFKHRCEIAIYVNNGVILALLEDGFKSNSKLLKDVQSLFKRHNKRFKGDRFASIEVSELSEWVKSGY